MATFTRKKVMKKFLQKRKKALKTDKLRTPSVKKLTVMLNYGYLFT